MIDVQNPKTFLGLLGSTIVINLTDATRFSPDLIVEFCLTNGLTFLEATSDAVVVERLHRTFSHGKYSGTLILGGGIFTGMSNLMGKHCAQLVSPLSDLDFAVSVSPFSGAGSGTIHLMSDNLSVPAVQFVNGERQEVPLSRGPSFTFNGHKRPTLFASLAEAYMLRESTKAPNVRAFFSPRPGFLVTSYLLLPGFLLRSKFFAFFMELYFTVIRKFLFSSVSTQVEMISQAKSPSQISTAEVVAKDGMLAGGAALAAMAEALGQRPSSSGTFFIDEVLTLKPILERANELAGPKTYSFTENTSQIR